MNEPLLKPVADAAPGRIEIYLNAALRTIESMTLAQCLEVEGLAADSVATAVNGEFVARSQRATRLLIGGDRVDVFRAIVGG